MADKNNIEQIWREYRSSLKSFLHSKIANPDDVDDLLQDILIKTYQNLTTLKDEHNIKSWLFQIANHTIIDFYRKKAYTTEPDVDELWYAENESKIRHELSKCLSPFISSLPLETAELLSAVDINGIAQKDYAEKVGIPYSTLKSRVKKGRNELKRLFENCCQFTFDQHGNIMDCDANNLDACNKC